jgi:predicted permease
MGYTTVFTNVLMMLFYLFCGYALVKAGKGESSHAKSLSGMLVYVCGPALILDSFQSMEYSPANTMNLVWFFLISLAVQILFFVILWLLLRRKYAEARYRILCAGAIFGNVGFFGLPLVTALFPNESVVACYSILYIASMNLLMFTVGVYLITQDRRYISIRTAILNPTTLTMVIAVPLYLWQVHFPAQITSMCNLLGRMSTPICMVVLGMRLASVRIKDLFIRPFAYAVCALKLIVFPLFAYLCVYWVPGLPMSFKICLFVLSAVPSASIILAQAELHECEQELSANVVLLTTLLSVITLPLLFLIVQS